ncbi:hypothetical protein GCM10011331_22380 [Flavimobilis marinus]|uniref:EpsG family protein n=2 Tax=Flavimobilis marinus TaxID=285351 RepID=A0A1I2GPT2_9MICO|nr:hypothetical protein GCM10011331_22380 [Flavimobilis marinus]SFF19954.1 EpsG family protein [Flavimobilis marinus]
MISYGALLVAVTLLLTFGGLFQRTLEASTHRRGSFFNGFDAAAVGILVLFAGVRIGVGTDYSAYETAYALKVDSEDLAETVRVSDHDIGFAGLQFIGKAAGLEFGHFVFLVSALTVSISALAVWRLGTSPRIALWFYVAFATYLVPMNLIRQGLAMAFVLMFAGELQRRSRWSIIWASLAIVSHYSSAVAVVALVALRFAPDVKAKSLMVYFISGAAGLLALVSSGAIGPIAAYLNPRYADYAVFSEVTGGSGFGTVLSMVFRIALVLISAIVLGMDFGGRFNGHLALQVTVGALMLVGSSVILELARLDLYFFMAGIFLAERVVRSRKRALLPKLAVVVGAVTYYFTYVHSYGGLLPYAWAFA